jgi:hypothetical protein
MAREEAEVAAGGRACSLTTVHCGATDKGDSANFALKAFPEVRRHGVLGSSL